MHRIASLFCALAALCVPAHSAGQSYPTKPIRMLTQFGPGAPGEVFVRFVAGYMSASIGQPVVVDARPGGGGVLAGSLAVRAAPDGYTLVVLTATVTIISPLLPGAKLPFDPARELTPITDMSESVIYIVVNEALPVKSLRDLIEYAKANPGKLSYGTTGIGSNHHITGEQIKMLTGADMVHVPYKTSPVVDAASGVLPVAYSVVGQALPLIKAGKIRPVAVINEKRWNRAPDVPTVGELVPGFEAIPGGSGLWGPANMPEAIIRRVHAEANRALALPEVQAKMREIGFEYSPSSSPEEYAAQVKKVSALIKRVVDTSGIRAEQ